MKPALAAAVFLFFPCSILAAPPDSTSTARPNSLHAGAWALQFSVVDTFDGGSLAFQRNVSSHTAFRLGVEARGESRDGDGTADSSQVAIGARHEENSNYSLHTELIVQRYVDPTAIGHFYYGVGPFIDTFEYKEEGYEVRGTEIRAYSNDRTGYQVGAIGILGAEWFASKALSLHIEYTMSFGYVSQNDDRTNTFDNDGPYHDSLDSTGWSFNAGAPVRCGIGIYF